MLLTFIWERSQGLSLKQKHDIHSVLDPASMKMEMYVTQLFSICADQVPPRVTLWLLNSTTKATNACTVDSSGIGKKAAL